MKSINLIYIYVLCLLFAGTGRARAQDNNVIFMNNGQPVSEISCGDFQDLSVKFPLPDKPGEKYDRVKFVLTLGDEEFKTRNYLKSEIYYYLSGKTSVTYTMMKNDTSEFTDPGNQFMTMKRLCQPDPNKPTDGYNIVAEARGYSVKKTDKNGKQIFGEPDIFAKGSIHVKMLPVSSGVADKKE